MGGGPWSCQCRLTSCSFRFGRPTFSRMATATGARSESQSLPGWSHQAVLLHKPGNSRGSASEETAGEVPALPCCGVLRK